MLFIPGWLIFAIVAAIVLIILLPRQGQSWSNEECWYWSVSNVIKGKAWLHDSFVEQRLIWIWAKVFYRRPYFWVSGNTWFYQRRVDAPAFEDWYYGWNDWSMAKENFLTWEWQTDISNSVHSKEPSWGNWPDGIVMNKWPIWTGPAQDNVAPDLAKMGSGVIAFFTVQSLLMKAWFNNLYRKCRNDQEKMRSLAQRPNVSVRKLKLMVTKLQRQVAIDSKIAQKQNWTPNWKQAALKVAYRFASQLTRLKWIEAEIQRREQERVAAEANIKKQEKGAGSQRTGS